MIRSRYYFCLLKEAGEACGEGAGVCWEVGGFAAGGY